MNNQKNPKLGHNKKTFLGKPVEHIDITSFDSRKIIDSMDKMSFTSRDTARATGIFNEMLSDKKMPIDQLNDRLIRQVERELPYRGSSTVPRRTDPRSRKNWNIVLKIRSFVYVPLSKLTINWQHYSTKRLSIMYIQLIAISYDCRQ